MRPGWKTKILAIVTAFAALSGATVQAATVDYRKVHARQHRHYGVGVAHVGLAYADREPGVVRGTGHHFEPLVGDPGSGYGFYQLPIQYRVGAFRYHLNHPPHYWDNPVAFAIATDAAGYHGRMPGERYYSGNDIFNPYDGLGTPFFAGYYR
jgi:hypothetical protein